MHIIRTSRAVQVERSRGLFFQADGSYRPVQDGLPPATRAAMPADWSGSFGADFFGRVRYRRTFQKPTGLETGERVWLVVEAPAVAGEVELKIRKRLG